MEDKEESAKQMFAYIQLLKDENKIVNDQSKLLKNKSEFIDKQNEIILELQNKLKSIDEFLIEKIDKVSDLYINIHERGQYTALKQVYNFIQDLNKQDEI